MQRLVYAVLRLLLSQYFHKSICSAQATVSQGNIFTMADLFLNQF